MNFYRIVPVCKDEIDGSLEFLQMENAFNQQINVAY